MNFLARQKKLAGATCFLRAIDALLVSHLPNIRYLCGFTGSAGLLLVEETGSVFLHRRALRHAGARGGEGRESDDCAQAVLTRLGSGLQPGGRGARGWTIGIEPNTLTVAERKRLVDLLPSGVRLRNAPPMVERARMVKEDDELALIRAAVRVGSDVV
jgi:Xaa-Pro aminopeptidase